MVEQTEKVEAPAGLLEAIHQYLLSRPMGEVEGLVVGLRKVKPVGEKEVNQPKG